MNSITLAGLVESEPKFSHEVCGEKFYRFLIISERKSGTVDILPCVISEQIKDDIKPDKEIKIIGEIRARNVWAENEKNHLEITVFVKEVLPYEEKDENMVELEGFICKQPIYRETPSGRQITDFIVASNRYSGKSDYIPSLVWGRCAIWVSKIEVGAKISAKGRLQSRNYTKQFSDGSKEERTAYELSVSSIKVLKEKEVG